MSRQPKISVLMTAYNAAPFIGEAIASVLGQTFHDFEFIIVNDGSTDQTEHVIRSFSDPRIVTVGQSNKGVAAALNRGLAIARAPYIARFDADDICYPQRLEKQYRFITRHPDHILVGSAADYVDVHGNYVFTSYPPAFSHEDIRYIRSKVCPFVHSSVLYRKDVVIRTGGYNEHAHSFEDHLLWMKITDRGRSANLREPLIRVRLNPGSVTIDEQWRPRAFHRIKNEALVRHSITEAEGQQLSQIIRAQDVRKIKEGAYHALLAKKYLWNNHQPEKARNHLRQVIAQNRFDLRSYCFYLLSFLPQRVVQQVYYLVKEQPAQLNTPGHE